MCCDQGSNFVKIFQQLEIENPDEKSEALVFEELNDSMTQLTTDPDSNDVEDDEDTHNKRIRVIAFQDVDHEIIKISKIINGLHFANPLTINTFNTETPRRHTPIESDPEPEHELCINIGKLNRIK